MRRRRIAGENKHEAERIFARAVETAAKRTGRCFRDGVKSVSRGDEVQVTALLEAS
jgi:hypothetical protein